MRYPHTALLAALLFASCATGEVAESTTTTTTQPTTTTTIADTTTSTTAPTTTTTEPDDEVGLPASWVGVTDDYEAVEVDTASGEVLRSIAQVSTAEDVETAECAACVNAVDAVWRSDTHFFVSECCEPAAGMIRVLTSDTVPYLPGDDAPTWFFWSASPSPDTNVVAFVGYQVVIANPDVDPSTANPGSDYTEVWVNDSDVFPISNAAWDGDRIVWLESGPDGVRVRGYERGDGTQTTLDVPELDGWSSAIVTSRGPGELVIARSPFDEPATEAIVIDGSGTVIERFPVEPGSRLGNYDSAGNLIYVDGDGVVRWTDGTTSGVLGEGFIQASW